MKIIFTLLLGFLFCLNTFAQSEENEIGVGEISLARDDGQGKPGEKATNFTSTEVPIYCLIELKSTKATTVKMNFVAARAQGLTANKTIVTVSYKTNGKQNGVTFTASPNENVWAAGKYRVDILLDGKPAKSLEFEIRKSQAEIKTNKQTPPKPKSKIKQKPRKS